MIKGPLDLDAKVTITFEDEGGLIQNFEYFHSYKDNGAAYPDYVINSALLEGGFLEEPTFSIPLIKKIELKFIEEGSFSYNKETRLLTIYNSFNQVLATLEDVDEESCEMLFNEISNEELIKIQERK